jgi:hypothetical protein
MNVAFAVPYHTGDQKLIRSIVYLRQSMDVANLPV